MTFYYQTRSWNSQPQISEETINLWKHLAEKKNWRITQLPNGFYQTEYLTVFIKLNTKIQKMRLGTTLQDVKLLKEQSKLLMVQ